MFARDRSVPVCAARLPLSRIAEQNVAVQTPDSCATQDICVVTRSGVASPPSPPIWTNDRREHAGFWGLSAVSGRLSADKPSGA